MTFELGYPEKKPNDSFYCRDQLPFNGGSFIPALLLFLSGSARPHMCLFFVQNPTWRSLDFGMLPDLLDTSVSCFVVRIWGGQKEQYQFLIEWKVNLDGLRYTGQQVSNHSNTRVFQQHDLKTA